MQAKKDRGKFNGIVRSSLRLFDDLKDGEMILSMLREVVKNPRFPPRGPEEVSKKAALQG